MPSYMSVVVLALAASNVSCALAAPVHYSREVPEQSLSRREDPKPAPEPPVYPPPPHDLQQGGVPPETGPTKGGAPPETGPTKGGAPPKSGKKGAPTESEKAMEKASKGGSSWKTHALNFVIGTAATMLGVSLLRSFTGSPSSQSDSSSARPTTPAYPQGPTYQVTNPHGQPLPGYQRRAADHDKRADFLEYMSDKNRRATSHLDLLTRADLGDALKLFSRVLDELD